MKDLNSTRLRFQKFEFWTATSALAIALITLVLEVNEDPEPSHNFFRALVHFYTNYIGEAVRFIALYVSFLLLNFYVVPRLIRRESLLQNITIAIVTFAVIGLVFGNMDVIFPAVIIFLIYSLAKYGGLYLWVNSETIESRFRFFAPGSFIAIVLWLISMFILFAGDADPMAIAAWAIFFPFGLFIYSYSFFSLIPKSLNRKYAFGLYIGKVILAVVIVSLPLGILAALITNDDAESLGLGLVNLLIQVFITAPFSWFYFRRYKKGKEELHSLKKELGHSVASFDFLRSQINPHFLFNALNTLYGTAIHENAERTSEGIQKLGDMMRFMLQENMQEKISLAREIDYLNNYIGLQRLRTDPISTANIHTEIEQLVDHVQISPMLLIPFVENAFKHGISLREPSYINITLEVRDKTLHFDVNNSKHSKQESDPEKDKSGIGLSNVKQRLMLLYPDRHELSMRETEKEFFVHLTIQLS